MSADVAQPDQARIVGINAQYFLKNSGNFVISIKASCIDSTAPPEAVFAREVRISFPDSPCIAFLALYFTAVLRRKLSQLMDQGLSYYTWTPDSIFMALTYIVLHRLV